MAKQSQFVIKLNEQSDVYMLNPYSPVYSENTWGAIMHPDLLVRYTQAEVDAMAVQINHGTVGLPRP